MRRSPDDEHGDIELIDVGTSSIDDSGAAVVSKGSSGWAPFALVAVLGLGIAGLAVSGGDEAAAPTTSGPPPSVTVPTPEEEDTTVTTTRPASAPLYGDGPDLEWVSIPADIDTTAFTWTENAFVALDGDTAWWIELGPEGRPIGVNSTSPLVDHPDYGARRSEGAWILTPNGRYADHLLVARDEAAAETVRVELPPPAEENTSEFVRPWRLTDAVVIGERVVVALIDGGEVDVDAIAERASIDLPTSSYAYVDYETLWFVSDGTTEPTTFLLSDLGLDADEIQALRRNTNDQETRVFSIDLVSGTADPALADVDFLYRRLTVDNGELSILWEGPTGGGRATTTDGVAWEEMLFEPGSFPYVIETGSVMYQPNDGFGGPGWVERSTDDGATWQGSPTPISEASAAYAPEAVFIGSPWLFFDGPETSQEIPSDNPDVIVTLTTNNGLQITVASATDPEAVLFEGPMWDDSRIQWTPALSAHVILDADGTALARVRQEDIDAATYGERADHDIAFGSWPLDADVVEWRRMTLREAFGDEARNVEFVTGDDAVLAVVTTTSGYEFFISPIGS